MVAWCENCGTLRYTPTPSLIAARQLAAMTANEVELHEVSYRKPGEQRRFEMPECAEERDGTTTVGAGGSAPSA